MGQTQASAAASAKTFISYSGNAEDVILHRIFGAREQGFYVDVGAAHPIFENDTCALYEQGWSGINIEPNPSFFAELARVRSRDRNLQMAVSDEDGTLTYWEVVGTGLSTCDPAEAARAADKGFEIRKSSVPCTTLAHILSEAAAPAIDVLKVDVEGLEMKVLQGNDWTRYRPGIVLVEATYPETPIRREDRIRPFLEQNGYDFAYFDGLNDFFVDREFAVPEGAFLPPNVFDRSVPYTTASLREHAANLERIRDEQTKYVESLLTNKEAIEFERNTQNTHIANLERERAETAAYVDSLRLQVDALEAERTKQDTYLGSLEAARAEQTEIVGALTDRVRTLEAEYTEQVNQAVALRSKVEQASIEIGRHEQAAAHLRNEAATLRQESGALRARAMRDRQEVVQALEAARIYGERQLVLCRELERAALTEAKLHASVARHVAVLAEMRAQADAARQSAQSEAEALRGKIAALHASTSWRISGPLRRLGRLLGRDRGR